MATTRLFRLPLSSFLRNPNVEGSIETKVWSRLSPFENTLRVLEDPQTGRKLYLIGTTHASTTLANRTRDLIKEVKPDTVYVMANEEWAERASHVKVSTQQEMTALNSEFTDLVYEKPTQIGLRGLIFMWRYYSFMFLARFWSALPSNFHPFQPGLEVKHAIETGKEVGANIFYGGMAFDKVNLQAMEHEKRMDVPSMLYRVYFGDGLFRYEYEHVEQLATLEVEGPEAFAETLDHASVNWWTNLCYRIAPRQKKILVNKKSKQVFFDIFNNCKGNSIVAVINHWHLPQVENYWRGATGTNIPQEPINPIGDFDINALMEFQLQNEMFRRQTAKFSRTETASSENNIVQFTDTTHEHERARHVFFLGANDPHLNHGLYNDENAHVEYVSEELKGGHH